jgi:hypothetical protein
MLRPKRSGRARQLSPKKLGVSRWQRDFWVVMVEHAQSVQPGPPDLSQLDGFSNPAVTRYAVTTPDLWHSFDKYNAGKPYHRQVRPKGARITTIAAIIPSIAALPNQGFNGSTKPSTMTASPIVAH